MAKFGSPPRFKATERQFHNGIQASVQNDESKMLFFLSGTALMAYIQQKKATSLI